MKKIFLIILLPFFANAQYTFRFNDSIPVSQYGNLLSDPWSGGINFSQWYEIDLNNDGFKDLFMFDRSNNRVLTMINNGAPNPGAFHFVDSFKTRFPRLKGWASMYDYNSDGFQDLFSVYWQNTSISQYDGNYTTGNGYTFSCSDSIVKYRYGAGLRSNILASDNLVADFNDLDNDGDMDIIAQQTQCVGTYAYFRNNNAENGYSADTLDNYSLVTNAWGNYFLRPGGYTYCAVGAFHISCLHALDEPVHFDPSSFAQRDDTYSVVRTIDLDGDGDKDAVTGDSQAINLLAVYNDGDSSYADMNSQDTLFPSYDTPFISKSFSAPSFVDLDNDGIRDLLVGNYEWETRRSVRWYKNTASNAAPVYDFQSDSLFQSQMIDVGEGATAVLADADNDGLTDLVIGNSRCAQNFSTTKTNLTFYKNTGTATNPSFELVTEDFASAEALAIAGPLYPAFGDLDNDGDQDMLVGSFTGILHLFTNNSGTLSYTSTNYMSIDVGNGSTPQLIDVNRDGLLDLIIGEQNGIINYYQNTGNVNNPSFSSVPTASPFGNVDVKSPGYPDGYAVPFLFDDSGQYKMFVTNMDGNIFLYENIDGNLNGTFQFVDTVFSKDYGNRYGYNFSISGADLNADGRTDVALGLYGGGAQIYYNVDPFMAVHDISAEVAGIKIYPNPATNQLAVRSSQFAIKNIAISDIVGKNIFDVPGGNKTKDQPTVIDISQLPAGLYFVSVSDGNYVVHERFLIQR